MSKFRRVDPANVRLPATFSLAPRKEVRVRERESDLGALFDVVGWSEVAVEWGGLSWNVIGQHLLAVFSAVARNVSSSAG